MDRGSSPRVPTRRRGKQGDPGAGGAVWNEGSEEEAGVAGMWAGSRGWGPAAGRKGGRSHCGWTGPEVGPS
jgi:hypothetical protein